MGRGLAAAMAALVLVAGQAEAAAACERAVDARALQTAALQQEMMVAALVCKDVRAYNEFVLSHQIALQKSDEALMAFFITASPRHGFDDYNLYKTELANGASLHSMHDGRFCAHVEANFEAAEGLPLERVLGAVPYPADTGAVHCNLPQAAPVTEASRD